MDLRHLRYFIAIVEAGSVTDASRRLHVVQPALSQRLAALEQELDVQLLIRGRQGMVVTAAGQELYTRAKSILKQVAAAEVAAREKNGFIGGRVAIGLLRSMSPFLATPLFKALRATLPDVLPEIVIGFSADLMASVNAARLDIALCVGRPGDKHYGSRPLYTEDMSVLGTREILKDKPESLVLADLAGLPMLISPTQPLHSLLQARAAQHEVALDIVGSLEDSVSNIELCCEGFAAVALPQSLAAYQVSRHRSKLRQLKLAGFSRQVFLYGLPSIPKTAAAQACEDVLLQVLRKHVDNLWL